MNSAAYKLRLPEALCVFSGASRPQLHHERLQHCGRLWLLDLRIAQCNQQRQRTTLLNCQHQHGTLDG